jgi:putative transposase
LVDIKNPDISLNRQLDLLGLNKTSYYYKAVPINEETLVLLDLVDKIYTEYPIFGARKMCDFLYNEHSKIVTRNKMRWIYKTLQIRAIYQEPKTTIINLAHKKYPYLLRNVPITHINHVWSTDITYVRLNKGFVYLSAIIDWYSRYVLSWRLHIDMEASNCVDLLADTLTTYDHCDIFNTDQGSQYTSTIFTDCLLSNDIKISMDGCGRWADNIWIERLWRSVKYECLYLSDFTTVTECNKILDKYFYFYNNKRPHQSLGGMTPAHVYYG